MDSITVIEQLVKHLKEEECEHGLRARRRLVGQLGGTSLQPGRMGDGVDLFQLLDRDLGVNLGGREFGMAKELLDKADIGAAFEHQHRAPSPYRDRLFDLSIFIKELKGRFAQWSLISYLTCPSSYSPLLTLDLSLFLLSK